MKKEWKKKDKKEGNDWNEEKEVLFFFSKRLSNLIICSKYKEPIRIW